MATIPQAIAIFVRIGRRLCEPIACPLCHRPCAEDPRRRFALLGVECASCRVFFTSAKAHEAARVGWEAWRHVGDRLDIRIVDAWMETGHLR